MSLPRFLVTQLPDAGELALDAQESRHASQVLRLNRGDSLELFDGRGGSAMAEVSETGKRETRVRVLMRTDVDRELSLGLELLIALPKGDRQKQLVDALVQLGVRKLTPLATQRSVAQPTTGAIERLERAVIESSKQCGRNRLMAIGQPVILEQLADDNAATVAGWFAHPYGSSVELANVAMPNGQPAVTNTPEQIHARAVVGPEGGLTEAEVELLANAGWQQVALGCRILRVEMAAMTIAAWWSLKSEV